MEGMAEKRQAWPRCVSGMERNLRTGLGRVL